MSRFLSVSFSLVSDVSFKICTNRCDQLDLVQVGLSMHVIVYFRYWIVVVRKVTCFLDDCNFECMHSTIWMQYFFALFICLAHCGVVILDGFLVL